VAPGRVHALIAVLLRRLVPVAAGMAKQAHRRVAAWIEQIHLQLCACEGNAHASSEEA